MLHVHRAERADRLVEALADVLADPPDDPFAPELVAVPTRGIERWLAQRLSHRLGVTGGDDGVCANVVFPSPADVVGRVLAVPNEDPWRPERLVWPLLETIDECAEEPWCAPLGAFLGVGDQGDTRRGRRFAAARHLARLFGRYADHRPALVRAWAAGDDSQTPDDLRWQPELWRRLRARVATVSPAETVADVRVPAGRFPARLSLFGATRLSDTELTVLDALAVDHDVHLWLPHPSPALWTGLEGREGSRRADDTSAQAVAHPLLASLGRDVRELQLRLSRPGRAARTDRHHAAATTPTTLLAQLQDDLRHDRAPAARPAVDDGSIRVHRCHGPDRQVEVLRETILGILRADPTLEPRDVIVLCPDIETFAPLVTASFGPGDGEATAHPGHRLRVRLADRSLREVNPLFGTLATLLDLADARVTASQLLDLAESDPVRRRFRFDDEDLPRLRELAERAGVRWGLDAPHRAAFSLARFGENTWSQGLDRLLVGVAMSADGGDWLGDALPLDEVDSGDAERVGRLGELVDRVGAVLEDLRGEKPLAAWIDALRRGLDGLTATVPADAWQLAQARAELSAVLESAPHDPTMTLHDVRAVLADRLAGRPTRANFRTGTLTVATLMPMRSVPHRVVCLLGMDDQVFPRETRADGDDVLARDPRVGERDPAAEDRQLLLDAIVAATDHLVVVHSGADERTGADRPPAVPIGELLDTLDATFAFADGERARDHLTRRNPLQPFDAGDFDASAPFSFDGAALAGTRALRAERSAVVPFLPGPLPARPRGPLDVDDLVRFVEHPVRAFLRQRLGVFARGEEEETAEAVPVEPDGLARWAIGERLLRDRLDGRDVVACMEAERRRGELPPGPLGDRLVRDIGRQVEPLTAAVTGLRDAVATDVDITSDTLVGSVAGVHESTLVTVTFSRLAPKHRLRAWIGLLALSAAHPDRTWRAVTVGRGSWDKPTTVSTLGPLEPEVAQKVLADLLALHTDGMLEPLPLMCQTSEAYAQARATKGESAAMNRARDKWTHRYGGEQDDPAHVLVWGRRRLLDDLVGAATGEAPSRFAGLATRLWTPVREAEELGSR